MTSPLLKRSTGKCYAQQRAHSNGEARTAAGLLAHSNGQARPAEHQLARSNLMQQKHHKLLSPKHNTNHPPLCATATYALSTKGNSKPACTTSCYIRRKHVAYRCRRSASATIPQRPYQDIMINNSMSHIAVAEGNAERAG